MTHKINLLIALVFLFLAKGNAQNSNEPKPLSQTFLIQNCLVVKSPGATPLKQNILIKDGMIIDIGTAFKVPFDAQIVKADSMYVYAGFIDAYSNTGVPKPESKDRPKIEDPGNPPNDIAGITPQLSSTDTYKNTDKTIGDLRALGFGIAHVSPRGLMLPGQGNVMLLGDKSTDGSIIKKDVSQNFQIVPGRSVFPSTKIGVLTKFKELYKNAVIAADHQEKFAINSQGLSRPDFSKEIQSLIPVTKKTQPLFFVAQTSNDVHKALVMQKELGFNMVMTDVKHAYNYIADIKKLNMPIVLSMELPEAKKQDTKKDSTSTTSEKKDSTLSKNVKKEVKPKDQAEFDLKKEEMIKKLEMQASTMEKEGIKFAFSLLNVKTADIKKNLNRMIQAGLTETNALAALTTIPAELLKISHLAGTIDKNKIANLVVTDMPYFNEKSSIKYVFVDGQRYEFNKPTKKSEKPAGEKEINIAGTWTYAIEIPGMTQNGKININGTNSNYKIKVSNDSMPGGDTDAKDVSWSDETLSFYIEVSMGAPMKVEYNLDMEGKSFKGRVTAGQFGTFNVTGDKIEAPKRN